MEFPNKDTILETASESLKPIDVLTHQPFHFNSVANLKNHSSLLNRTGHVRFRRAPVVPLPQPPQTLFPSTTMPPRPLHIQPQHQYFTKPTILRYNPKLLSLDLEFPEEMYNVSSNSSLVSSAITGDTSISNIRQGSYLLTPTISGGKPYLSSSSLKNKSHGNSESESYNKYCYTNNRKNNMKTTVRVSDEIAVIPNNDGYLWRKYGQKDIAGSPYPRGYYKCTMKKLNGCPALKMVERAQDDPKMMIVTYKEEHCHERVNHRLKFKQGTRSTSRN